MTLNEFVKSFRNIKTLKSEFLRNHHPLIRMMIYAVSLFLCIRIISSLILLIGTMQPPTVIPNDEYAYQAYIKLENSNTFTRYFISPWFRWDTVNYLGIAENGYNNNPLYTVWPPLYPFLIKAFSIVFKPPLFAAIIISNLFFIIAIVFFLKLITEFFDESCAKTSLFYLILFPTSFYLIAPYTESIFLALSLAVIYASIKRKWLIAGVLCGFASLTRVQGVLLVIPIFVEGIIAYKKSRDKKIFIRFLPAILFAPMTYGIYCLYVRYGLIADWPWTTLSSFWGQHFGWPWEGIIGNLSALFGNNTDIDVNMPFIKLLTVIVTLFAIFFCFKARRKLPLSISIYSFAVILLALCKVDNQSLMVSTMRYLLPVFPIFIGQAMVMDKKWMKILYFAFGVGVNLVFIIFNFWWIWVA